MHSKTIKDLIYGFFILIVIVYVVGLVATYKTSFQFSNIYELFLIGFNLLSPIVTYFFIRKKKQISWFVMLGYTSLPDILNILNGLIVSDLNRILSGLFFLILSIGLLMYVKEDFFRKEGHLGSVAKSRS